MKNFIATQSEKLSKMLLREYAGSLSFARLQRLFRNRDIRVNQKRVNADTIVNVGDEVMVYFDGEIAKVQFVTLYEDDNVVAVIKPKAISSEYFYESIKQSFSELFFCHRLDTNTDGVMLFAKNQQAYDCVLNAFKNKQFEKYYECKVYGKMPNKSGELEHYLLKDNAQSTVKVVEKGTKNAVQAVLQYTVVESCGKWSKLKVRLLTGRTHQIRVQLAHVGHFILGDDKYGNRALSKSLGETKMCLTAKTLVLRFDKNDFLAYLNGKMLQIDK